MAIQHAIASTARSSATRVATGRGRVTGQAQAQPLRVPARPWHNLAAQVNRRYLFDALGSVGHDFGIEIDGFRAPGI